MNSNNFTPSTHKALDPKLQEALDKKSNAGGSLKYSAKAAENYVRIVQNGEKIEKVLVKQ